MGLCKVRGVQDGTPKCDVEDGFIGVSARAARETGERDPYRFEHTEQRGPFATLELEARRSDTTMIRFKRTLT
jgi:hypothetical protein